MKRILAVAIVATLARVAGPGKTNPEYPPILGGDDQGAWAPNRSPRLLLDEAALPLGVRALANLAVDYLSGTQAMYEAACSYA